MSAHGIQGGPAASPEEVARALEAVLGGSEFEPGGKSWLARSLERVLDWLGELFELAPGAPGALLETVLYVVAAVLLALILWRLLPLVRSLRSAARRAPGAAAAAETLAERVARLFAEAEAERAAGEHLRALRLYFWVLVIGLSQRGGLSYRDAWTGREMLEHGRPSAEVRALLTPLVPEIDRKSFGGEHVRAEDSERLAATCKRLLGMG